MSKKPLSMYVLIDALGWEILRDRSFLDDIIQKREPVDTILGYSSGAIPTLLTGKYPSEHGHWNLFFRSPETSPFRWTKPLTTLPSALTENRASRRLIKSVSHRLSGYSGYFAIYNLPVHRLAWYDICETTDIYSPGGLAPTKSIFDLMLEGDVNYRCYNYHSHTDAETLNAVPAELDEDCSVYFLYLSGLDAYLHFNVGDEDGVTEKLRWYEDGLRRVYNAARGAGREPRLFIFSDHGMTPIQGTQNLIREVERLGLSSPGDYLPAYDSTMARFWFSSSRGESEVRALLGSLPYGRVLPEKEVEALGLSFGDSRYGDLIFLMEPGTLIVPSDMGRIVFQGMHGFHPHQDPHSKAVFLASTEDAPKVEHITDVLPALLDDLHLTRDRVEIPAASRA